MILNLEVIPANRQDRRDQATHYFEAGDAVCFVGSANGYGKLTLVFDNIHQLRERGIYEEALLTAYTGVKGNLRRWSLDILKFMFEQADQARLRAAGNPLPHEGPFTLYRGVSGKGRARRVRGLSWTASREHAWWFARRWLLADPAVFRITVGFEHVLAYVGDREEEFLVLLPSSMRPIRECPKCSEPLGTVGEALVIGNPQVRRTSFQ